jgi:hypothetical protein
MLYSQAPLFEWGTPLGNPEGAPHRTRSQDYIDAAIGRRRVAPVSAEELPKE